jgi:hypothetical protein
LNNFKDPSTFYNKAKAKASASGMITGATHATPFGLQEVKLGLVQEIEDTSSIPLRVKRPSPAKEKKDGFKCHRTDIIL